MTWLLIIVSVASIIIACVAAALAVDCTLDPDRCTDVREWWRRVRPWGWITVRDTGITRYQVHPSGRRRVQLSCRYRAIDALDGPVLRRAEAKAAEQRQRIAKLKAKKNRDRHRRPSRSQPPPGSAEEMSRTFGDQRSWRRVFDEAGRQVSYLYRGDPGHDSSWHCEYDDEGRRRSLSTTRAPPSAAQRCA